MRVTVNGVLTDTDSKTIGELGHRLYPDRGIAVADGRQVPADTILEEGMTIYFGEGKDMRAAMLKRDDPDVESHISGACVGIAGLGGLGSNIAAMLARTGVGRLVIADFDCVDLSNLNRQNYFVEDLGLAKTDATEKILKRMSPFTEIEKHTVRLTPENIPGIFGMCDVVCEAFDAADQKAMIVSTMMERLPDIPLVSGSGMAGAGDANSITTKTVLGHVVLCGDGKEDGNIPPHLMAPRVNVCAGHMANAVIRLLTDKKD